MRMTMKSGTTGARLLVLLLFCAIGVSYFPVSAQLCSKEGCDTHERCAVWATEGECIREKKYMMEHCPGSCAGVEEELKEAVTKATTCEDHHAHCPEWADLGECDANAEMLRYCAKSCNVCVADAEPETEEEDPCQDLHANCKFWSDHDECSKNPNYMTANCKKSCKTCEVRPKKVTPVVRDQSEAQRKTIAFGTLQSIAGSKKEEVEARLLKSIAYMQSKQVQELPEETRTNCRNRHELCALYGNMCAPCFV